MSRNIRLLYVHNFLTCFRFQAPYLVIYFLHILGSYTASMAVMATEQITSALMDIPTGIMSDRIGRKTTLAIGSLASAIGIACYAFADGLLSLIIGAVFYGLSTCLFNGNNNALLYETLKAEGKQSEFHHFQGRTGSMFELALGLSALCSSLLATHGLRLIFIIGIVPQLLAAAVSLFFVEPKNHESDANHNFGHLKAALIAVWHNPRLRWLIMGNAVSFGAGEASFNFRNVFINQLWPLWALGIYRAVNNAGGFIGYWFSGKLIDKFKSSRVLVVSETYWFLSQEIAVMMSNIFSPLIFMTGALFYGPTTVAVEKLMQNEFTDRERATMGSVSSFAGGILYMIMAFVIGGVSDAYGAGAGVGTGVAIAACMLPVYIMLFRRYF